MAADNAAATRREVWRRSARGVGLVGLAFSLAVGAFLVADQMGAGQLQTVRATVLDRTLAAARQSPADRDQVAFAREMDRLARHAYFSSVAFQRRGLWMLVAGLLVALGGLHAAGRLGRRIEDPRLRAAPDPSRTDRRARAAVLLTVAAALALVSLWQVVRAGASRAPTTEPAPIALTPHAATAGPTTGGVATAPSPVPPAATGAVGWCCFRGPLYGVSSATNAPVSWNGASGQGVAWKSELTKGGLSSPVVWGGRVYLTEADAEERAVLAFDARTGSRLWRCVVADGGKNEGLPETTPDTGLAASTAACDADGVYAIFGTGDLVALTPDGKTRWQVFLRRPANPYGHASSLWTGNGLVCVQYDQSENGRLLALKAADGSTVWEVPRTLGPCWSSPVVVPGEQGEPLFVVNGSDNGSGVVNAYDLATGVPRWQVAGADGEVAPSPAWWNGRLYVANAGSRLTCYQLGADPQKAWDSQESLPEVASPVAANGLLFLAASSGELACLDAADGKALWQHEYKTGFYASPIICGDRVYALDRDGVMRIVAAERTFREIASCPLGESADATPAFAGGRIFVRTRAHLWCLGAAE